MAPALRAFVPLLGLLSAYRLKAYAEMEKEEGHPSRAALVLERAESEGCCLHELIWLVHSDLLISDMSAADVVSYACLNVFVLLR